ncbi:MAG: cheW2, partial [Oscillospiraceae bacterium]|nr:cheW2 [Oscillospiraceae bacterium]
MSNKQKKETEHNNAQKDRYLIFFIEVEFYAIELKNVVEIVCIQPIIKSPDCPNYVKGFIHLRNNVIPVIDLRKRFRMKEIEYTDRTCIIVVDINGVLTGLIVDKIHEVTTIEEQNIIPPPVITKSVNKYVKSMGIIADKVNLIL